MSVITKRNQWKNKQSRIAYKINKKLKCPKIIIFRSNKNISVQLIDNKTNSTICSSSSLDKSIAKEIAKSKMLSNEELILGKVKYNDKILHQSKILKYYIEEGENFKKTQNNSY